MIIWINAFILAGIVLYLQFHRITKERRSLYGHQA